MKTIESKKKHRFRRFGIFPVLLSLMLCVSCSDETPVGPDSSVVDAVTIEAEIPGIAAPATRGMSAAQEDEVREIDVLVFSQSGGNYVLEEHKQATSIAVSGGVVSFRVRLTAGTNKNLVVLANARAQLGTPVVGIDKSTILSALTVSHTGKWAADGSTTSGYEPIPMAGETSGVTISAGGTISGISLIRMLARIDVKVSTPDFSLSRIYLCNNNQTGQITPALQSNGLFATISQGEHLPASPNKNITTPLTYTPASPLTNGGAYECEIYTFESNAGSDVSGIEDAARKEATCLVLEGFYNGQKYFYRVDFARNIPTTAGDNTTVNYMPLLRNYKYVVDITSAGGIGYNNLNEALASYTIPSNLKTRLIFYDLGKVNNIVYNGQYMLGISRDEINLTRDAYTGVSIGNEITIFTDNPTGWIIDGYTDGLGNPVTWLSLQTSLGATSVTSNTKIITTQNTTGAERTGYIHLKAGRLKHTIKIIQSKIAMLDVFLEGMLGGSLNGDTLHFISGVDVSPSSQQFRLIWAPSTRAVNITNTAVGNALVYDSSAGSDTPGQGSQASISDPAGSKIFTILPTAVSAAEQGGDPFYERKSLLTLTITDGVETVNRTLTLKQQVAYLLTDHQNYYRTDGSTYSFYIKSNTNWRIKSVTESLTSGSGSLLNLNTSLDNLRPGITGAPNTGVGTFMRFRTANNSDIDGTVIVVFESPEGLFSEKTLVLNLNNGYYPEPHKGWAGSNIYWDGTKLTFDDTGNTSHENYQGLFFKWGSLWGLDPSGGGNRWTESHVIYKHDGTTTTNITMTQQKWWNIPFIYSGTATHPPTGKTHLDRHYLIENHNPASGIGDICKSITEQAGGYLHGKKWRMPTAAEFGSLSSGNYNYIKQGIWGGYPISTSNTGTYVNPNAPGYRNNNTIGTPFFPAAGQWDGSYYQRDVGNTGYYWSATVSHQQTERVFRIRFWDSNAGSYIENTLTTTAYPVRCVQE